MLYLNFLILLHALYDKSVGMEFTVKGGGKIDADKFVMDIHVESVNNATSVNASTTVAPTNAPTTEPNITSHTTSISTVPPTPTPTPTPLPSLTPTPPPPSTQTPPPSTQTPANKTDNSTSPTSAPPTTLAATTLATTVSTNSSTTPTVGSNTTTVPGEGVSVTNPTPAPDINDLPNSGNSKNFLDLSQTALQLHNYYRSIHEAPLLTLDATLEKDAQEYADQIAKNKLLRPQQDFLLTSKNEGENLGFRCSVTRPDPAKALRQIMKRWYDEGCKYNFQIPPSDRYSYRHFTQMTWKGSRSLGVGISYGKVNNLQCLYYVARYRPRGNIGNAFMFMNNVKKGVFDSLFCKPIANQLSNQEVILKD